MLLVTAFEPFGGRTTNRSERVARLLAAQGVATRILPVDFARLAAAVPVLVQAHARQGGSALVMLGEHRGDTMEVERVALNVLHARIADQAGQQPQAARVIADGAAPLALLSTFDSPARPATPDLVAALTAAGVPARLSHHAGTYACNAAYYLALHAGLGLPLRTVFCHLPVEPRLGEPTDDLVARALLLTFGVRHGT
jgi:pyroglutamyl-peptidase